MCWLCGVVLVCRDVVVMSRSASEDAVSIAMVVKRKMCREVKRKSTSAFRRQRSLLEKNEQ